MKRITALLLVLVLSVISAPLSFASESKDESQDFQKIISDIQKKLESGTSKDVRKQLSSTGLSVDKPEKLGEIKPKNIIESGISIFTDAIKAPLVTLGKLIAVALLCVIIGSVSPGKDQLSGILELVCLVCTVVLITDTLTKSFAAIKDSIQSINSYLIAYLPVFSGITLAGGNVIGSNGYLGIMLMVCEIMGLIASKVLLPFLSVLLAITLVSCINPRLRFSDFAGSVKKIITVGLGLIMTVFTGLMTIQGIAGASVDNVSSKAIRFAASSFIPIIGSSVSEAYSSVKGSLGVIRTSVGSIGIIVLFIIILRPLISVIAVKFVIFLAKCVNEIFGQPRTAELLKSINSVLSIAMSILIAYAIFFTVATSILMLTAFNAGG